MFRMSLRILASAVLAMVIFLMVIGPWSDVEIAHRGTVLYFRTWGLCAAHHEVWVYKGLYRRQLLSDYFSPPAFFTNGRDWAVSIPWWLVLLLVGSMTAPAFRLTRQPNPKRAFPVELTKSSEGKDRK